MNKRKWLLLSATVVLTLLACNTVTDFGSGDDFEVIAVATEPVQVEGGSNLEVAGEGSESGVSGEQVELTSEAELAPHRQVDEGDLSESFLFSDCPFEIPFQMDISCGVLTVPEKRTENTTRSIQLAVAIVHAPRESGLAPIVYLAGGPGGSAIDEFVSDPEGWDYPFTRNRDLILIDQRGTGYSLPSLDCPELSEESDLFDQDPEERCRDRLVAAGIDLSAFNTVENAADIATLRQALDLEDWNLMGISYGTRLALITMRDHPQGIRSAILDSVFPPDADTPGEEALAPLWSLDRLFTECASDSYCSSEYPDLRTVFLDTVVSLNDSPDGDIYGDDLVFAVTSALNNSQLIPIVPSVIYAVAEGDTSALAEIAADGGFSEKSYQSEGDRADSEGMYNSVICHEEYSFGDYNYAEERLVEQSPEAIQAALIQPVASLFRVCEYWGAGVAAPRENEPVASNVPTLILAGQYDSATPLAWAFQAQAALSNAYLFEFPGAGHALLSDNACAISITGSFLENPAQQPDSGCLQDIEWPYFE